MVLSTYADDVTVFINNKKDVQVLADTLFLYQKAASVRVNWGKTEAL